MEYLTTHWVEITAVVGGIVTVASLITKMTPTQADDKVLAKIVAFLNTVALNPKK